MKRRPPEPALPRDPFGKVTPKASSRLDFLFSPPSQIRGHAPHPPPAAPPPPAAAPGPLEAAGPAEAPEPAPAGFKRRPFEASLYVPRPIATLIEVVAIVMLGLVGAVLGSVEGRKQAVSGARARA